MLPKKYNREQESFVQCCREDGTFKCFMCGGQGPEFNITYGISFRHIRHKSTEEDSAMKFRHIRNQGSGVCCVCEACHKAWCRWRKENNMMEPNCPQCNFEDPKDGKTVQQLVNCKNQPKFYNLEPESPKKSPKKRVLVELSDDDDDDLSAIARRNAENRAKRQKGQETVIISDSDEESGFGKVNRQQKMKKYFFTKKKNII